MKNRKIGQKKIHVLTDRWSIFYLSIILFLSSLPVESNSNLKNYPDLATGEGRIIELRKSKKIEKLIIEKWKYWSYMIENLRSDRKIDFWRLINRLWSKINFWLEPLSMCIVEIFQLLVSKTQCVKSQPFFICMGVANKKGSM